MNPLFVIAKRSVAIHAPWIATSLRLRNDTSRPVIHPMRKLNLGCGFDKREGFVNADNFVACDPDIQIDIEHTPWQLEDSSFDYILMKHVLEHVGADFATFSRVMRELYRVTAPQGVIEIHVPHFRHDTWWSDPTHVRAFTPLTFRMMSRKQNDEWIAKRANYTMLAHVMQATYCIFKTYCLRCNA